MTPPSAAPRTRRGALTGLAVGLGALAVPAGVHAQSGAPSTSGATTTAAPAATTTAAATTTSAAPATARPRGGTWRGSRGSRVRSVQRTLVQLGLPVGVDGRFGPGTERAVRRYEREEGIKEDGAVSRAQLKGMRKRATPRRTVRRFASRTLRPGVRGTDVRAVQRLLVDLGVDGSRHGVFTAATARDVRTWEQRAGMEPDGLVGKVQAERMEAAIPEVRVSGSSSTTEQPAPAATPAPTGDRVFPIRGAFRWGGDSTSFGDRGGAHQGVDVFAECGTPLVAVEGGEVRHNQTQSAAGNYLIVRGAKTGIDYAYMHMRARSPLQDGAAVATGAPIGEVGDSGNADGCHLHFEQWTKPGWYEGGEPYDPEPDLRALAKAEGLEPASR